MCTVPIIRLLPQYKEVKGVGIGVSRYRPNFRHDNYRMCTLPTIQLPLRRRESVLASCGGTNAVFLGITILTKFTIGVDSIDRVFDWIDSYNKDVSRFSQQNLRPYNKQKEAMTIKQLAISPNLKSRYSNDSFNQSHKTYK